jgi:hypothetical protein
MKRIVLELLSKGGNPHSISKNLQKAKSTIVEHLQGLRSLGLATKGKSNSYGELWVITEQGKQYLEGSVSITMYERKGSVSSQGVRQTWLDHSRSHNIKIKFQVQETPDIKSWIALSWKPYNLKNNVFYTKRFGEVVTTFTGKNMIFQLPPIKASDPEIANAEAGRLAMKLKEQYEKEVSGLKLGTYSVHAQIISQHHAVVNDPFAKWCQKEEISYRDKQIDIDASSGQDSPELEFTDPKNAHTHFARYVEHQKDIIENEVPKISEIAQTIKQIVEANRETANGLLAITEYLKRQIPKTEEFHFNHEYGGYFG